MITRPEHSLVDQATHALYTPFVETSQLYNKEQRKKRDHSLNADGFGLGWYSNDGGSGRIAPTPTLIKSCAPPWSSAMLFEIAESTTTGLLFAHIRAASPGLRVTETNCHPFRFGRFMFMHNGGVGGFGQIKEALRACLRPSVARLIEGTTDSEHVFALFVNEFPDQGVHGPFNRYISLELRNASPFPAEALVHAMRATIRKIRALQKACGVSFNDSVSSLNFAVTDGTTIIATRCRTHPEQDPPSLYYSFGSTPGVCPASPGRLAANLVIASEPPIFLGAGRQVPRGQPHRCKGYTLIPKDHMVIGYDPTGCGLVSEVSVVPLELQAWEDIDMDVLAEVRASPRVVKAMTAWTKKYYTRPKGVVGDATARAVGRKQRSRLSLGPSLDPMVVGAGLFAVGTLVGAALVRGFGVNSSVRNE